MLGVKSLLIFKGRGELGPRDIEGGTFGRCEALDANARSPFS